MAVSPSAVALMTQMTRRTRCPHLCLRLLLTTVKRRKRKQEEATGLNKDSESESDDEKERFETKLVKSAKHEKDIREEKAEEKTKTETEKKDELINHGEVWRALLSLFASTLASALCVVTSLMHASRGLTESPPALCSKVLTCLRPTTHASPFVRLALLMVVWWWFRFVPLVVLGLEGMASSTPLTMPRRT